MAQIILRPSRDISRSSNIFSSGNRVFSLLNEANPDGDSTFVSWNETAGAGHIRVGFDTIDTSKIKKITNIIAYFTYRHNGYGSNVQYGFIQPTYAQSGSHTGATNAYRTSSQQLTVNKTPAEFNLSSLDAYFSVTSIEVKSTVFLTHIYVVINYEEALQELWANIGDASRPITSQLVKLDGSWRTVTKTYTKVGGTWRSG